MDEKGKKYLKWGICGVLAAVAGIFVLPIAVTIAWNLVSLCAALAALGAAWLLLPVLSEAMASAVWYLKGLIWKNDPVGKLWRDLFEFGKEIDTLETNIAEVATAEELAKSELRKQKPNLDAADILQWNEDISGITSARTYLMEERDQLRNDYKDMERVVRNQEANWKIGNALNKAAETVNAAGKIAAGTQGGRVSMDAIQERLAQGRAKLAVLKSRRSVEDIKKEMAINVQATVVPTPVPVQRVSLTNNPSPVIPAVTGQVVANTAKIQSKNDDLVSRL